MSITISILPIMFPYSIGYDLVKQVYYIRLHAIIPVLLDHDASGRTLCIDGYLAILNTAVLDDLFHLRCDINQHFMVFGGQGDHFSHSYLSIK